MNTATSSLRSAKSLSLTQKFAPIFLAIALLFNVLAPIFALSWTRAPFLGSLFYPQLVVADAYRSNWQGHQQGLRAGDVLLEVDGVPVSSGGDLLFLRGKRVNESALLQIERENGQSEVVPVVLEVFSLEDLLIFFWLSYSIGVIYLVLGLIIYRVRGTDSGTDVFASFCALASILTGGIFDHYTLHFLTPLWALVVPLVGSNLIHLGLVFPRRLRWALRQQWLRYIGYVPAILLAGANLYAFYLSSNPRLYLDIRFWNFSFLALAVAIFLVLQILTRFSTLSSLVRQQTSITLGGTLVAFGPALAWWASSGAPLTWSAIITILIPMVVFPITLSYAMLRYRLLDLDLVFNNSVAYTLLTLLVTVVYFLIVSVLGALLQDYFLFRNPLVLAIFVVILVISLEPLKQQLQGVVNRLFQHDTFDYRQLLQRYGRALISSPLSTDHILEMLAKQANEALNLENAMVFLRDPNHGVFKIRFQQEKKYVPPVEVQFGLSDDLAKWLADTNNILQITPEGTVAPEIQVSREELARLSMLNVNLCVPLLGSEHLLGWLALGFKKSGQPYSSNDLLYLATLASQTIIALENAQLLEQANRKAAELEALQNILVEIQAEAESDTLLTMVVRQATRLLHAEGGMVFLLEPDNKTLKVVVSYNLDQDYIGYTLEVPEGVAGRAVMLGQSVVVDHYHNFAGRSPKFQNARFGAVLGVPLRWGGQVRGVLDVIHRPNNLRFSEGDIWLMELFAVQSAIALEQSRLLQEARRKARQLATLSEVTSAVNSTLDLDTALQRVMERSVQLLNAEAGSLFLLDPEGKELTFEVVLGPSGKELVGMKTPVGKGIVGTVAQTGEPLIINDVAADPRWNTGFDQTTDFKTKDILCVPMITHNRVIGVIEVLNKQDGTVFSEEECGLLMSFGAQAAIAIENAQLFTRVDRALAERVQELQTVQMFDQELQTSLELRKVLDIALTHVMDALGAPMGVMGVVRDDHEPGLYLLAQRGMPMEMSRYKVDPWPLTRGIMGRVVETGKLAIVHDITQAKDYIPKTHRTRSMLVLPIVRDELVIGVINLESPEFNFFTEDDAAFVNILISQAAIAIDNARLFDQVRQANQAKSEFMSTASHELKIPMTSIKGYAKLLQMGAGGSLTEKQNDFLTVITNNVDRMDRLVSDLLDVSRIEAGRIRLEIEDVQMSSVISDVVKSIQTQIEKKKLNLDVSIAEDLPEIRADYNRMVQIVTNLLSNAYKYTPEGGNITVTAIPYNQNGSVEGIAVTVKDTGYGIAEEDQDKLFTTFFRSGDQNIRNEPGTGLGLSITKRMIETHGGALTFESKQGIGSSFTFTAPLISKIPPGVEVVER